MNNSDFLKLIFSETIITPNLFTLVKTIEK